MTCPRERRSVVDMTNEEVVHHWPLGDSAAVCGMKQGRAAWQGDWTKVTCQACLSAKSGEPLMAVHKAPTEAPYNTPCGLWPTTVCTTLDWAKVTCGGCLLEQPADTRGMPERKLAPEVERRLLAERRERQIAEVQSLADRVLAQSADAARLYASAMDTLRRLRASLAALQGEVVPEEGKPRFAPHGAVQDDREWVRVLMGYRAGDDAVLVSVENTSYGATDVTVQFADEVGTRTYDSRYVEIL